MAEKNRIYTPDSLNDLTEKPKAQSSGGDMTSTIKEANALVNNIMSLFNMANRVKAQDEQKGNAQAKYEKGVEAGKSSVGVELIVDEDQAFEKFQQFQNGMLSQCKDDETVGDLKKKLKEQFEGEDKNLVKGMIGDFIRSHARAVAR